MLRATEALELAVVVLDDLGFLDVEGELVAFRLTGEGALELLGLDGDIRGDGEFALDAFLDDLERAVTFEGDDVADRAEVGGDVDLLAVDEHVAVVHELTGTSAGAGEAHAEDEVVEAALQDAEEGEAGDGRVFLREDEEAAELALIEAIEGAKLLLLEDWTPYSEGFLLRSWPCWPGP